jgi:hypothetical protein
MERCAACKDASITVWHVKCGCSDRQMHFWQHVYPHACCGERQRRTHTLQPVDECNWLYVVIKLLHVALSEFPLAPTVKAYLTHNLNGIRYVKACRLRSMSPTRRHRVCHARVPTALHVSNCPQVAAAKLATGCSRLLLSTFL